MKPSEKYNRLESSKLLSFPEKSLDNDDEMSQKLQLPGTSSRVDSLLYLDRLKIEKVIYAEIEKPACLLRIKGASKMGKTSIIKKIVTYGKEKDFKTVKIDFSRVDREIYGSFNRFLPWFFLNINYQLKLKAKLDDYWDEDFGIKTSCTMFFQDEILEALEEPLLLVLSKVDWIFKYPDIYKEFFPLLRSWHEEAGQLEVWINLRLIVVHATEVYIPLNINQSPFNVGLPIKLPGFTLAEVKELAARHGLKWETEKAEEKELEALRTMVGGQPYLIRLALYYLATGKTTFSTLLKNAATVSGIYSNHLRQVLDYLRHNPKFKSAFRQVINQNQPILEPTIAYQLESLGSIELEGNNAKPKCQLYSLFFKEHLV